MDISGIFDRTTQGISDAIKGAAQATGASFEYLLAAARAESGLNPQASAPTSTARGLYQFVDQTWLATMKRSGASLGYAQYAVAIVETAPGQYQVPDPTMRRDIMALRDDPTVNAALAGALTRDNAAILTGHLGRKATDGEVYLAHVLGVAGATRLTMLAAANPGAPANAAFPAAAGANRAIFYDPQGRPRSVADVYSALVGRYDSARLRQSSAAVTSPDSAGGRGTGTAATAVSAPTSAATTPTLLPSAASGMLGVDFVPEASTAPKPLFNGLFSDRGGPASEVVKDLWSDPPQQARAGQPVTVPAPATLVSRSSGASLIGRGGYLFQNPPTSAGSLYGP